MEKIGKVLIELLAYSYREQKRFILSMNDETRSAVGSVDDWSPKDVMAHIVHWDSMTAADLADLENRPADQSGEDFNRTNARIWERYKETPWSDIEALIDQTHEALENSLKQLGEDDLSDPERFDWLNGRMLWRSIAFTNCYHPVQHVAVLYAKQGDLVYANQIEEGSAEQQMRLSDSDEWRGTVFYNLGCHYAVTGQKDLALKKISRGLQIYPVLSKWAKDDPDLDMLRDDPRFAAMIQDE
jgi:hypothetical protein